MLEAADLGDMLLKTVLEAKEQPLTDTAVDAIEAISASFPTPPPPASISFAKAASRWANHAPAEGGSSAMEDAEGEVDHPHRLLQARLHTLAGRVCTAAGAEHRPDAQKHYLEAFKPTEFAAFLHTWAGDGYESERDLFLARAVLQLLCLGNMRDANAVRNEYYRLAGADAAAAAGAVGNKALDTPLCHFLRFLLLTLEVRKHCLPTIASVRLTPSEGTLRAVLILTSPLSTPAA